MRSHSRTFTHRLRAGAVSLTLSGALLVSGTIFASPIGATTLKYAAPSQYCKTLISFSTLKGAPSTANLANYRKWVAKYLPKFKTLEAEAPNASVKRVIDEIVVVLKSEVNLTSAVKLQKYIGKNQKQWTNDWKTFAQSAMTCVTSLY